MGKADLLWGRQTVISDMHIAKQIGRERAASRELQSVSFCDVSTCAFMLVRWSEKHILSLFLER